MTVDFSSKTMETRKKRHNIFQVLKENCQARIIYTAEISFKNEREIKTFSNERKLTESVTRQSMLKMTKGNYFKQKRNSKRRKLGTLERKDMVSKNMGKWASFCS